MVEYTLPIAAHQITVTATAISLLSLLDTANGSALSLPNNLDAVQLYCEDGDIRITTDGSTPTASLGEPILQGSEKKQITSIALSQIMLIRSGSADVAVSVRVGYRDPQY